MQVPTLDSPGAVGGDSAADETLACGDHTAEAVAETAAQRGEIDSFEAEAKEEPYYKTDTEAEAAEEPYYKTDSEAAAAEEPYDKTDSDTAAAAAAAMVFGSRIFLSPLAGVPNWCRVLTGSDRRQ